MSSHRQSRHQEWRCRKGLSDFGVWSSFPHSCGYSGLLCWGVLAFPREMWRIWMHMSGLWLPLRIRNLNHKGCMAKAGTVPEDLSTLKSEKAGVKEGCRRGHHYKASRRPSWVHSSFSHGANWVEICLFSLMETLRISDALPLREAFPEITGSVKVHSLFCYSLTAFSSLVCHSTLQLLRAGKRDDRAKGSTDNIKKPEKQGKQGNIFSSFSYSHLFPCWKAVCGLWCFTLHFTQKLQELFFTYCWRGMAQCSSSLMVLNHDH